jgi:hypothetical protein
MIITVSKPFSLLFTFALQAPDPSMRKSIRRRMQRAAKRFLSETYLSEFCKLSKSQFLSFHPTHEYFKHQNKDEQIKKTFVI